MGDADLGRRVVDDLGLICWGRLGALVIDVMDS